MNLLEDVKRITEKTTGWKRPDDPQALLRERKLQIYRFKDDGLIPNHPKWPLVIYKSAVRFPESLDPAAVFEDLFETNGWGNSWRDGIYDYAHYHSRIHEVLGIARGTGRVQFGGPKGRTLILKAGDVAILPAGTGHQCLKASDDFLVVGAYPPTGTFDICKTPEDRKKGAGHDPESRASAQGPCLRREGAAYADLAQAHSTTNHKEAARAESSACAFTKMAAPDASAVAALLREFGQRSALRGGNPFRAKAYARAADSLLALSLPLDQIIAQGRLREIPGIGDTIADIIKKLHATGTHPALEKMRKEIPAGVLEMLTIPGLRADKVLKLYQELGFTSLAKLEEAAREGRLKGLRRGSKVVAAATEEATLGMQTVPPELHGRPRSGRAAVSQNS
jgi:uncharacterized protein YjlB